jgi:S-formylglutathione hydrolase FrmB
MIKGKNTFLHAYLHMETKFMRSFIIALALFLSLSAFAGKVDSVNIYSNAMKRSYKCVVIKPDNYKKIKAFPVVYLLHGYSGNFSNWITRVPQLKDYADKYQLLIVCPEGEYSSWYVDSPVDSAFRFETYVGKEVPAYIDANFKTIKNRNARAIAGLSMGGHGALFIAFRNASKFGACGSMSGVMDIGMASNSYDLSKRIGDTIKFKENWTTYSVMHVIESYPKDSLAILFDCGIEDRFYRINQQLHQKMLARKIPHDYIERPGKHDWPYWRNAVQYQLLFFRNYFDKFSNNSGR